MLILKQSDWLLKCLFFLSIDNKNTQKFCKNSY